VKQFLPVYLKHVNQVEPRAATRDQLARETRQFSQRALSECSEMHCGTIRILEPEISHSHTLTEYTDMPRMKKLGSGEQKSPSSGVGFGSNALKVKSTT